MQGVPSPLPAVRRFDRHARIYVAGHQVLAGSAIWRELRRQGYVHLIARACLFLMEHYDEELFINVGSGEELSIRELAERVRETVGFKGEVVWDHSKPDGTPRKRMDSSRIRALGWEAQIRLEQGLPRAYEDFLLHHAS